MLELLIIYSVCLIKLAFCLVTKPKEKKPEETYSYTNMDSSFDEDLEGFFVLEYKIKNDEKKYLH